MNSKNRFGLLIAGILILGAVLYVNRLMSRITTTDLKYNTRYSANYCEKSFNSLRDGMNLEQLKNILGDPFEILEPEFEHSIIYSENKVKIEPGNLGVEIKDAIHPIGFCRINFKENGKVYNTFNSQNYIDSTYLFKLKKLTYNEIIKLIGEPLQEYKCDCNCKIYNYSRLKDGAYSGKNPVIKIKRVAIDKNNLIKHKIDEVGNPYNKQIGICKI